MAKTEESAGWSFLRALLKAGKSIIIEKEKRVSLGTPEKERRNNEPILI